MSLLYSPFVAQWNLDCAKSPEYKVVASISLGKDIVEGLSAFKKKLVLQECLETITYIV